MKLIRPLTSVIAGFDCITIIQKEDTEDHIAAKKYNK